MRFANLRYLLVFCLTIAILSSCQNDGPEPEPQVSEATRFVFSKDELPQKVREAVNGLGLLDDKPIHGANDGIENELYINWEQILQLVDSTGKETYTFAIENDTEDFSTFYNLILKYNKNGVPERPFLMKYSMDESFIPIYLETESLADFSGTVQKIFLEGIGSQLGGNGINDIASLVPCPQSSVTVGSSTGGGTSGPGGLGGPGPGGFGCEEFVTVTDWYKCLNASCTETEYMYSTSEYTTECNVGPDSGVNGVDDDCEKKDDVTPILPPDLLIKPCPETKALEENAKLRAKLIEILNATKSGDKINRETGYLIDGDTYDYKQGERNSSGITLSGLTGQYDGFIHSHYQGLFPTFTPGDVVSMYTLMNGGNMNQEKGFYMGLTTFGGSNYLLMIDDSAKFETFGKSTLTPDMKDAFKAEYLLLLSQFSALPNRTEEMAYELALLTVIKNSGLKLYKGNSNFTKWKLRKISSQYPTNTKCS